MNFEFLALVVLSIARLFIYVVIASALLSFFLPPYHPVREALGRIIEPFLGSDPQFDAADWDGGFQSDDPDFGC